MPFYCEFVGQSAMFCLTQIIVVCAVYPLLILPFSLIIAVFIALDVVMNGGVVQSRKLENQTKSPILHHLSSAMAGITIIRGYQKQHVFQRK